MKNNKSIDKITLQNQKLEILQMVCTNINFNH